MAAFLVVKNLTLFGAELMTKDDINGSCSWVKWRSDGTPSPESKGHYLINPQGVELLLCGTAMPQLHNDDFSGGVYVDCKRCQKIYEELN